MKKFLRLPDVMQMTGLARATVYSLIAQGKFPPPVKLSERSSAWVSSEIDEWMSERIAASRKEVE
ncbi:hypothetical protein A3762_13815 [Oleiphilus sp. HI0125]|uniref:helix-turn-helix transcriptional regulator n=1 Tax=Oleiphilus sp. HI0125 TaxID=1822266 RepID=UPI0007C26D75|nr:AlpA family transcriptional regulator [Oleiphilus sp. HI0125]KZZ62018.1 hypothetical protein A3762_13815 [Oleiphilus sp. HI0125]